MKIKLFILSISICCSSIIFGQTTVIDSIYSGGMYRNYRLYVPPTYDGSEAVPVVLNLHGYSSDNFGQDLYANFHLIADTANFLILLPNGTKDFFGFRFWNCFVAPGSGVDDVQFIDELLDSISSEYNVDQNRIYSTGMSNGGFMSHTLACELSNRITAIASVTGSIDENRMPFCDPQHNMPVMQIHGTADGVIPYNGDMNYLSIDSVVSYWVNHNNCDDIPEFTEIPDIVPTDGCTAEHYVYGGCNKNINVELFKIIGGGHTWPGTAITFLGITNLDINACNEIWRFFSQYSLDQLTGIENNNNSPAPAVHIYPNPASENINIDFSPNQKLLEIAIYDLTGKVVFTSDNIEVEDFSVNINKLNPGYYLIKFSDGENVGSQRFIKN